MSITSQSITRMKKRKLNLGRYFLQSLYKPWRKQKGTNLSDWGDFGLIKRFICWWILAVHTASLVSTYTCCCPGKEGIAIATPCPSQSSQWGYPSVHPWTTWSTMGHTRNYFQEFFQDHSSQLLWHYIGYGLVSRAQSYGDLLGWEMVPVWLQGKNSKDPRLPIWSYSAH